MSMQISKSILVIIALVFITLSCSVKVSITEDESLDTKRVVQLDHEYGVFGVRETSHGGYRFRASIGSDIVSFTESDGYTIQPIWMAE